MVQNSVHRTASPRVAAAWLCLLVCCLATAGPAPAQPPAQPREAGAATAQNPPFKLAYVPRDSLLVCATRPAALLQREPLASLRDALVQLGGASLRLDLSPEDVSEFTLVLLPGLDQGPPIAVILRLSSAPAAQRFVSSLGSGAQPRDFAGQTYFRLASRACYFQPDKQSIVFSPHEPTLLRCVAAGDGGATTTTWYSRWMTVAGQDAAAVVNTSLLRGADFTELAQPLDLLYGGRPRGSQAGMQLAFQLAPLWRRSDHIVADIQVDKGITLRVMSQSATEDEAQEYHTALLTAISVLRTALSRSRGAVAADPNLAASTLLQNIDLVDEVLEKAQVVRRNAMVGLVARLEEDATKRLAKLLPPAVAAARTTNSRTRSLNNLKMIAIAFHNYHDTYKTFPAAIQLGPKNTPRSWRVTLLPFLGQEDLYQQYRQDEPWDSEHNRQVLARMPEVFRHPLDDPSSTNASYFTLVGPETVFPGDRAVGFAAITDGTSNTLLVVESKQETPWTKPEDIPFDSQRPLPKLGGWIPQGSCVATCDGGTRFFAHDTLDERMLRFLIMRSDGNAVQWPPQ